MRSKLLCSAICFAVISCTTTSAQIVSAFDWETDPTTASTGPDAVSVSGTAYISADGSSGSGLNPGPTSTDIDLQLDGSTFDLEGFDISIDYQRDEPVSDFIHRGSSLQMGINGGKLRIQYRVEDGLGGYTTVSATGLYTVPNDDTFRTYRFAYKPSTGVAEVFVNGSSVWLNTGSETPGMNWYTTGLGDLYIGLRTDGQGDDKAAFDNFSFTSIPNVPLPIELTTFEAKLNTAKQVELAWETASELNNDFFTIERSTNGFTFEEVARVVGAGTSSEPIAYTALDEKPAMGMVYYRLKQTDFDGKFEYSDLVGVSINETDEGKCVMKVYPNPCMGRCTVQLTECPENESEVQVQVYDASGNVITSNIPMNKADGSFTYHINTYNNLQPGVYIVRAASRENAYSENVVVD